MMSASPVIPVLGGAVAMSRRRDVVELLHFTKVWSDDKNLLWPGRPD